MERRFFLACEIYEPVSTRQLRRLCGEILVPFVFALPQPLLSASYSMIYCCSADRFPVTVYLSLDATSVVVHLVVASPPEAGVVGNHLPASLRVSESLTIAGRCEKADVQLLGVSE